MIYRASDEVKAEIEMLTNGGTIEKKVHEDITYKVNSDEVRREGALGYRESGTGRYDILVYKHRLTIPPVVLELKVAGRYKELDSACEAALAQIAEKTYYADLAEDGYREVICYGVAFYKKQVRIHVRRKELESKCCFTFLPF